MDQGQTAAFPGALDRPPTSTWEIMNPREYEHKSAPTVPLLPNIHPLVDKLYKAYDIGQVGQLDLHILAELFGGDAAARDELAVAAPRSITHPNRYDRGTRLIADPHDDLANGLDE